METKALERSAVKAASHRRAALWILGARPQTLAFSATPVATGAVYSYVVYDGFVPVASAAALAAAGAIQIATNLANDSADGGRGGDGSGRLGPKRLVGAGLMPAERVRAGAITASFASLLLGLIVTAYGGAPILVLGLASLAMAWGYSYGPMPISGTPLGEIAVVAFFGMAATMGSVWLNAHHVDLGSALLGAAIGLPAAAVLTVNNHRDRAEDAAMGRRTLALLLGPRNTPILYGCELFAAALAGAAALAPFSRWSFAFGVFWSLAALILIVKMARTPISSAQNHRLAATVRFQIFLAASISAVLLI